MAEKDDKTSKEKAKFTFNDFGCVNVNPEACCFSMDDAFEFNFNADQTPAAPTKLEPPKKEVPKKPPPQAQANAEADDLDDINNMFEALRMDDKQGQALGQMFGGLLGGMVNGAVSGLKNVEQNAGLPSGQMVILSRYEALSEYLEANEETIPEDKMKKYIEMLAVLTEMVEAYEKHADNPVLVNKEINRLNKRFEAIGEPFPPDMVVDDSMLQQHFVEAMTEGLTGNATSDADCSVM